MIQCLALDDEPLALAQMSAYIKKVPYLELVAACHNAESAQKVFADNHVDLLFSDINMPGQNGIDFVRSLTNPPLVIFTTAYAEYAVEGFKVNAVDYLLKPFGFQEFEAAVSKARLRLNREQEEEGFVPSSSHEAILREGAFFIKNDYRISRVSLSEIRYIESMGEYVRIFLDNQSRALMPLLSMKRIEEVLPEDKFMRVHRSYIVNLEKVTEISRLRIVFDDVLIPVGDSYKQRFLDYINARSL